MKSGCEDSGLLTQMTQLPSSLPIEEFGDLSVLMPTPALTHPDQFNRRCFAKNLWTESHKSTSSGVPPPNPPCGIASKT